jgi:hypothetical protein
MLKIIKFFWRKAEVSAAKDIMVFVHKSKEIRSHVRTDQPIQMMDVRKLEDYIVNQYIIPDRLDGRRIENKVSGDPNITPQESSAAKRATHK